MGFKISGDGDCVYIKKNGVEKQVPLATRDGNLYAQAQGGFIRLKADGSTSVPGMYFDAMEYDGPLYQDRFGRLCVQDGDRRKALVLADAGKTIAQADGSPGVKLLTRSEDD